MNKAPAKFIARLPRLEFGSWGWHLPLNDHAACELARILVIDDPAAREARVAELMALDPVVTLWAACRAGQADAVAPRRVLDLARWLAGHLLPVLVWPATEAARSVGDMRSRWRELAADSIAVAHLAADQAADDQRAAEAFLLGLLHNAADWLRSCGPRISMVKSVPGCLPAWLIAPLRDRSRGCEAMQLVLRSAATWREAGRRGRRIGRVDLLDVMLARKRWQGSVTDAQGADFLPRLTDRLRRLQELQEHFGRTLEQEKLQSLGELAYGASHEINNPLANISTRAQAMLAQETDLEKRRMLAIINAQAFRANEMIADMMLFARPPAPVRQRVDLVAMIDTIIAELQDDAELQGTRIERQKAGEVLVDVDPTQMAMALRSVLVNALQALVAEGQIDVAVETLPASDEQLHSWACVTIHDTGPGIRSELRRHIFDPFFSGREAGRGLGLGLAKCWRVVTLHGGRIDVTSQEQQGTTFIISLPIG
ncbi:MAG: sensor histidine kinase [Pirellulaceae bacterium]